MSDRKNTLVPAVERPEEKTKARFAPPTSSQEVASVSTPFVPKNTARQTQWSVKVFNDWSAHRNSLATEDTEKVPDNFLSRPESRVQKC